MAVHSQQPYQVHLCVDRIFDQTDNCIAFMLLCVPS